METATNILSAIDPVVIGERLAEARRARRLTQQQAANALGVARTTVTAIEQGARRVRSSELLTLARLYERPVGDFVRPVREPAMPGFATRFRSLKGLASRLPDDERDADCSRFEELCRWYVELEEMLGAPLPRRYPDPYDITDTPPERAGEEVALSERNRLGLGDGPIGDLRGLLEADAGLRIFGIPMTNQAVAGLFLFTQEYGACVAVNANHPEERQRWTIAHEYAHFLTEARFDPEITLVGRYQRLPERERFAEAFARNFLIPGSAVTRRFDALRRARKTPVTQGDLLTLSRLYGVSLQAMARRLEELMLLPGGPPEQLLGQEVELEAEKRLSGEPGVLLPPRYELLAVQAYTRELLSEGQLARRLAIDRVEALLRVRQLTEATQTSPDGVSSRIALDLNAALAGAS